MRRKIIITFLLVGFFSLNFKIYSEKAPIGQKLEKIPHKDRLILERLFKRLLSYGEFASTLFGKKPGSHTLYHSVYSFDYYPDQKIDFVSLLDYQGWKTWLKYQDLFSIENYYFSKSLELEEKSLAVSFDFIFKPAFEALTLHEPLLNEATASDLSLLSPKYKSNIKVLHTFYGLTFGYPKNDITTFTKCEQLSETLSFFPYEKGEQTSIIYPVSELLDGDSEDLVDAYENLQKSFQLRYSWDPEENPFFCSKPYVFRSLSLAATSPTIEALKQKIVDLYNSDHFLEDFLEILEAK
ncbi:MAG: hypothetical protein ACOYK9_02155 [Chlamydiia bacterium]